MPLENAPRDKVRNTLEKKIYFLSLAREGRLHEAKPRDLEEHAEMLTNYDIERETRPELLAQLTNPAILAEYLESSEEQKREIETFRRMKPNWSNSDDRRIFANCPDTLNVLRKQKLVNTAVRFFDEFMKKRKPFQMFSLRGLYDGVYLLFGNSHNFLTFAAYERSDILTYSDFIQTFKIDGVRELIDIFDTIYLRKRERYETFTTTFLANPSKEGFSRGTGIVRRAWVFEKEGRFKGGYDSLLRLALETRPDIKEYTHHEGVLRKDMPGHLFEIFKKYKKDRKRFQVFDGTKVLEDKTFPKGSYRSAYGTWSAFMRECSRQYPELEDYLTPQRLARIDAPQELIEIYDKFMKKRKQGEYFTVTYLLEKDHTSLYSKIKNYFKNGICEVISLAARERPEITQYWRYSPIQKYVK